MPTGTTLIDWSRCSVLESKPDTQGGAWVFRGTRVPVTAILRNIGEMSVPELSQKFSTVRPEQITGLLVHSAERRVRALGMRVLLDENLPQRLRLYLPPHQVFTTAYLFTTAYQGWAGLSNGALVAWGEAQAFDVLATADQGLNYRRTSLAARSR
jgi:uncharacterized protein (DUF433 family)